MESLALLNILADRQPSSEQQQQSEFPFYEVMKESSQNLFEMLKPLSTDVLKTGRLNQVCYYLCEKNVEENRLIKEAGGKSTA